MKIPFNKPYFSGRELQYMQQAIDSGKISGDGQFTKACHAFFEKRFDFKKVLLTTSCTDALEMAALLCDIRPGDEVIMPSYTFVSTANAFVLRGARIVFVDSEPTNPNMDVRQVEPLITPRTRAIVVVHYAGVACDMAPLLRLARKHDIHIIEDAAQAIASYYNGRALGSFGTFAAFSFHETKNIVSGEGGMLVINDEKFVQRAEVIREKGTNRSAFFRGEVDKYGWVDIGSSYLPSDLIAAYLYAQLENLDDIQRRRLHLWNLYHENLASLARKGLFRLPRIPNYATNNAHMFYIVCATDAMQEDLLRHLRNNEILAVFHYLSLHKSDYYRAVHGERELPHADLYTKRLIRLPLFYDLEERDVQYVAQSIHAFFR